MERCGTCKHWAATVEWDTYGLRVCGRVREQWRVEEGAPETIREMKWSHEDKTEAKFAAAMTKMYADQKAVVMDGSSYKAELRTTADYGCVLHESK